MPTAIVLGSGMVGSVMAMDLAADPAWEVCVADARAEPLEATRRRVAEQTGRQIETRHADLADDRAFAQTVADHDIVLGALGSAIGLDTLRRVIEAGKPYADISFMPEDALTLNEAARERGVTAIVDCGVAPGLSNMMAGDAVRRLDRCDAIEIYVGGLPRHRHWPFEYKAGFSPHDVIEEYTRPSRLVENGQVVVREALSEPELMEFAGVGTLEAFNTDGLRSLIATLNVTDMKEKTLRYPGHIEIMRVLRHLGLFSGDAIDVAGQLVRPIDLTSALLFPKWTYQPGEADMTVMRVIARGQLEGAATELQWNLLDEYDAQSSCTSMSRTTAFPCTIIARMILNGEIDQTGVIAPEQLTAKPGVLDAVLGELAKRRVTVEFSERVVA